MTDENLRSRLIHLAKEKPELREHLLPLLRTAKKQDLSDRDQYGDIGDAFEQFWSAFHDFPEPASILPKDREAKRLWRELSKAAKAFDKHMNRNYTW